MTEAIKAALDAFLARWARLPGTSRGALWILMSASAVSSQGALVKYLGGSLDSFEIVFLRCLFGLVLVAPFAAPHGLGVFLTGRPALHVLRSLAGMASMTCGFYAVTRLPLADVTALTFTAPLFMIPLAVMVLGERVRWRRWTAALAGFSGVLIMARPSGSLHPAVLVALLGALFSASVYVLIKQMAATERAITMVVYFCLIGSAVSAVPAALVWRTPGPIEVVALFGVAALGAIAQVFSIRGWRTGEATALAPFEYSRLLFAGIFGYLFFTEVPDGFTVLGAGVIVASTLYIARREARAAPSAEREPLAPGQV
ncbi:MAG: DMT family transporter [Alphaproteobacteria bacterium]